MLINIFSPRWTIRHTFEIDWSSKHRTGSILLTVPIIPQRQSWENWRLDEKAIEPMIQRPLASWRSPISREVGRKFRDLIQDDSGAAIGKTRNGRTMHVLSRNADFFCFFVPWASSDVKENIREHIRETHKRMSNRSVSEIMICFQRHLNAIL